MQDWVFSQSHLTDQRSSMDPGFPSCCDKAEDILYSWQAAVSSEFTQAFLWIKVYLHDTSDPSWSWPKILQKLKPYFTLIKFYELLLHVGHKYTQQYCSSLKYLIQLNSDPFGNENQMQFPVAKCTWSIWISITVLLSSVWLCFLPSVRKDSDNMGLLETFNSPKPLICVNSWVNF